MTQGVPPLEAKCQIPLPWEGTPSPVLGSGLRTRVGLPTLPAAPHGKASRPGRRPHLLPGVWSEKARSGPWLSWADPRRARKSRRPGAANSLRRLFLQERPHGELKKHHYFKVLLNVEVLLAEIPHHRTLRPTVPSRHPGKGLKKNPKASPHLPRGRW